MINIFETLRFNLRAFGLRGLRLPVYVYSRLKLYSVGRIEVVGPWRRGMLKIGMHHDNSTAPYTIFNNTGLIELHGRAWLHHGCRLKNSGRIILKGNDIISHECTFDIRQQLVMGRNVSIGFSSVFIDSDMHFLVDVEKREVAPNRQSIDIGDYNWLGSHTYIKKGTRTPAYAIVASAGAVLSKDYTQLPPYSVLAGAPARKVAEGKRRIFNFRNEERVRSFFANNQGQAFHLSDDTDLDRFCDLGL